MAKVTSRRAFWVLGVVLLVGTVAGAGWLFRNPAADAQEGTPPSSPGVADSAGPLGVIAHGYVDVKDGVRQLYPLQTGRVVWVVPEGKVCEKDEVVLRLDDRMAKDDVERAKAALQEARARHEQAKILPEQHEADVAAQKKAITFAERQVDLARQNQKLRKAYKDIKLPVTKSELDAGEALVLKTQANVELEQAKLTKLQKIDPQREVERALADVNAKKADLDKAEKAVEQLYTVRAPAKGTVLRVQTAAGELAGPQSPQIPIQYCPEEERLVRTEVMQDWAAKVKAGQECDIQDDAVSGKHWKGNVTHVSDWFTHRRSIIQEPFQLNDVRTLECLVSINGGAQGLRIGQRLRVTIKQGGP